MATKTQTLYFENEHNVRTGHALLILEPKLDTMPLSYQCIIVQAHAKIFLSKRRWEEFKRCKNTEQQHRFLHKHCWTYEPGKMLFQFEEKFIKILLLHGIDDPMTQPVE